MKRFIAYLTSLSFGIWLMAAIALLLALGSFTRSAESGINDLALFDWLRAVPFSLSWWLWGTVILLALLVGNTILCSIDSLRFKLKRERFFVLIGPQIMHIGFLLMVLAHLLSAEGGMKEGYRLFEGSTLAFADGASIQIERLSASIGPMGMPTDFSAQVNFVGGATANAATLRPNQPLFHGGFGVYLKEVALVPLRTAYVEVHREPGAPAALAGALLFVAGNLALLWSRRGKATRPGN